MKKLCTLVVVVCVFGWLMGCASSKSLDNFKGGGGGGGGSASTGNWDLRLTSGTSGSTVGFGGQLLFNGTTVTGNLVPYSDNTCFYPSQSSASVSVSGTIANGTLPLTIATPGGTFTIKLAVPTGSSAATTLAGTYTIPSGCLGSAASGSVAANLVSGVIGGTWSGTDSGGNGATLTFDFNVATSATTSGSLLGTFQITPVSVTFTPPSGCTITGATINPTTSYAAGEFFFLDVTESENGSPAEFLLYGIVDSPTAPANFAGAYNYVSGGTCLLNTAGASISMTKQ